MNPSLTDAALARSIAAEAGNALLALRRGGSCSGKLLGDRGDNGANDLILAALRVARPDDAILSEESTDDPARIGRSRVWIIDPLDGTREYCEGRDDWAVHVGLAIDGIAAVGAVGLPELGQVFATDDVAPLPPVNTPLRMVVSRTRPAPEALMVAEALGAELVPMGSAGAKAMAIVRGIADIYLHSGGQYQWDSCAPIAVARAAGLHVSRIDGSPLVYNVAEVYLPDLLICSRALAPQILALIAEGAVR